MSPETELPGTNLPYDTIYATRIRTLSLDKIT